MSILNLQWTANGDTNLKLESWSSPADVQMGWVCLHAAKQTARGSMNTTRCTTLRETMWLSGLLLLE